jgi:hypothetical protein
VSNPAAQEIISTQTIEGDFAMVRTRRWLTMGLVGSLVLAAAGAVSLLHESPAKAALAPETSTPFSGKGVNRGTVTHEIRNGKHLLTLSSDFEQPTTPDPHWQVVDSRSNVFLLDRLTLHEDKVNTSITLPPYISDVATVRMWCAWAEIVLGEASFAKPIALK